MGEPTADQQQEPIENADTAKEKTFTQAEMERILGTRLEKERAKFADYDALRAKAGELDKLRESNQSEMEKAVAGAKAEGMSEATARANQVLVRAEARAQAAAASFHNPHDAARLLDLSAVVVTPDGDVDVEAIKKLIEETVRERPYLIKSDEKSAPRAPRKDPAQGARPGEKPSGAAAGMAEALRRFGANKQDA